MSFDLAAATNVELAAGVVRIVVSTAARGCSLDGEGLVQGTEVLAEVAAGRIDAGAVLLVGTGGNFCAGGDVRGFHAAEDRTAHIARVAEVAHAFSRALYETDLPIVAAAHGWAAGAGFGLVLSADVAVGSPTTRMRPAYPGIGLSPDAGMSWLLPRVVGFGRARSILLTDEVISGEKAFDMGILARLVDDEAVALEAATIAAALAAGPRPSYAAIRHLLRSSASATLDAQLDAEALSIARLAGGAAGREGVDAFVEKRRPDFRGL